MKRITHSKVLTILLFLIIYAAAIGGWLYCSNRTFTETFYSLYSPKIDSSVRIVLLSDLHQTSFGKNNEELVRRINELKPDVILISGDIITYGKENIDYASSLCEQLVQIAPVCFGLGNHENMLVYGDDLSRSFLESNSELLRDNPENFSPIIKNRTLLDELEAVGVTVIQNEAYIVQIGDVQIEIGGISTNSGSFWNYSGQFVYQFAQDSSPNFKILISHRPEPVMEYIAGYPIDLVVSGHTHGGIIRIPGKGGLLAADGGLFPEYDSGLFETGPMTMIVSKGLGGHGWIPRIFNPPELVVIDLL